MMTLCPATYGQTSLSMYGCTDGAWGPPPAPWKVKLHASLKVIQLFTLDPYSARRKDPYLPKAARGARGMMGVLQGG